MRPQHTAPETAKNYQKFAKTGATGFLNRKMQKHYAFVFNTQAAGVDFNYTSWRTHI
jgi:hypothetical protein